MSTQKQPKDHPLLLHYLNFYNNFEKLYTQAYQNLVKQKYSQKTSLSPGIYQKLVNQCTLEKHQSKTKWATNEGLLDWTKFKKIKSDNEEEDFAKGCQFIQQVKNDVHELFSTYDSKKFVELYKNVFERLNLEMQVFVKIFEYHKQSTLGSYIAFTLLSTWFERIVASIFLTKCLKKKPVPNLLKDILVSEEVVDVLGEDTVFYVRLIIGPPIGLNLRNVLWHGFLCPSEFYPAYTSFLFILFASVCQIAADYFEKNKYEWIEKDWFTVRIEKSEFDFGMGTSVFKVDKWEEKNKIEFFKCLGEVIRSSYFVIPGREEVVEQAFLEYLNGNYVESLSIILPQLEHSIRRIFVAIHENLPQRMLCAESRVLFSTLELLLAYTLESKEINLLPTAIGENMMAALRDFFIHGDGPRIRDRIAHCEMKEVPSYVAEAVLGLYLALAMQHDVRKDCEDTYMNQIVEPLQNCYKYFKNYIGCFHPKSVVIKKLHNAFKEWNQLINEYANSDNQFAYIKELTDYECKFSKKTFLYSKVKRPTQEQQDVNVLEFFQSKKKTNDFLTIKHITKFFEESIKQVISNSEPLFFGSKKEQLSLILNTNGLKLYISHKNHVIEDYKGNHIDKRTQYLNLLGMLSKVLDEIRKFISQLFAKRTVLLKMINNREARTQDRKVFGAMIHTRHLFVHIVHYLGLLVERELHLCSTALGEKDSKYDFVKRHKIIQKVLRISQRMTICAQEGEMGNAVQQFCGFLVECHQKLLQY